jgi:hypothetical protein
MNGVGASRRRPRERQHHGRLTIIAWSARRKRLVHSRNGWRQRRREYVPPRWPQHYPPSRLRRSAPEGYVEHCNNRSPEQCGWVHHPEEHARRALTGDPRREGPGVADGAKTTQRSRGLFPDTPSSVRDPNQSQAVNRGHATDSPVRKRIRVSNRCPESF